ncbi:gluconokinase [uncultured Martelella sp.]|uniref:gluconokinase n=1 Tax=uncultured Martelella sp. TaxID=392331 RepID=UPI0029C8B310|nr:gluconokinase [uncultured Martelella sp.]
MGKIPAIVVMGVSGCGKSSVGQAIADEIHGELIEGDAYHPPENIRKMSEGHPLDDSDRQGWLERLADLLAEGVAGEKVPVLACSALKKSYRDILRSKVSGVAFVFLDLPHDVAKDRVANRPGHFMPASLIDSQFDTLERPDAETGVFVADATLPISTIAENAVSWWMTSGSDNEKDGEGR